MLTPEIYDALLESIGCPDEMRGPIIRGIFTWDEDKTRDFVLAGVKNAQQAGQLTDDILITALQMWGIMQFDPPFLPDLAESILNALYLARDGHSDDPIDLPDWVNKNVVWNAGILLKHTHAEFLTPYLITD